MKDARNSSDPANPLGRRHFLKIAMTGGIAAAAYPHVTSLGNAVEPPLPPAGPAGTAPAPPAVPPFELDELSIDTLQEGMKSGRYTSRGLVEKYIGRIEEIDRKGPSLRAVIELNPDALTLADALDKERKEKGPRGPLHGIPVLIKDNIATADRMATTAGSLALVGSTPAADAHVAQQLRKAGAVILGKTNLSEWANIRSSRSTSGWSGRGGLTRNPYALDRNTSGSSSGSGAAVAACLCAAAVGTETDGSIVSPSSINGIVGVKPTLGLISRTGIIPIAHSQDTAGPMARTVRDAAILLGALAGIDAEDAATATGRGKAASDYTTFLDPQGLRGARVGVVRKFFGFHDRVDALMTDALSLMKQMGAVLVDPVEIATIGKFDDSELLVLLYELKADLNAYLARLGPSAPVHSLKEIIEYNERNAKTEMPYFAQETFLKAQEKGPLTTKEYLEALEKDKRMARKEGIDATMEKHKLDVLVGATDGPAWVTDLICGDHFLGSSSTVPAVAGYPHVTVPAGFVHGLPIGISFIGRAWSEPQLLKYAYSFEQAARLRKPPRFLDSADPLS